MSDVNNINSFKEAKNIKLVSQKSVSTRKTTRQCVKKLPESNFFI